MNPRSVATFLRLMRAAGDGGALDWQDDALCAQTDPDLWFPNSSSESRVTAPLAKRVCARCEVRVECLEYALATESAWDRHGVWGGLTPRERAELAGENAA